jgi:hypothetical protein
LDHFLDVFQSEIERTPIGLVLFLFKINGKLCVLELRLYLCFTFRSLDQVYILEETGNLRVLYTFLFLNEMKDLVHYLETIGCLQLASKGLNEDSEYLLLCLF